MVVPPPQPVQVPDIVTSPANVAAPPTCMFFAIPTPPAVTIAPVVLVVDSVSFV